MSKSTKDQVPSPKPPVVQEEKIDKKRIAQISSYLEGLVINVLGTPKGFYLIKAHHLWDDKFRVNVLVESGHTRIISDSFFVVATLDGIVRSMPDIRRKYE